MKTIFLLLAIASTAFATAQSNVVPLEKMSQKDIALRKVKDLDKILDLNETQKKKLLALYSGNDVTLKSTKSGKQFDNNLSKIDSKLKSILSPIQYAKLIAQEKGLAPPKEIEKKEIH